MPLQGKKLLVTNIVFVVLSALSVTFATNNAARVIKLPIQCQSLLTQQSFWQQRPFFHSYENTHR